VIPAVDQEPKILSQKSIFIINNPLYLLELLKIDQ